MGKIINKSKTIISKTEDGLKVEHESLDTYISLRSDEIFITYETPKGIDAIDISEIIDYLEKKSK